MKKKGRFQTTVRIENYSKSTVDERAAEKNLGDKTVPASKWKKVRIERVRSNRKCLL